MADQPQYLKPLPKTIFNEYISVIKNNPRITVRTEVESDAKNGVVHASMDGGVFYWFLECLRKTIDLEPGEGFKIENKNHTYVNGERSKDPVVTSTTLVGKDEDSIIYLAVIAKNVTPVKFMLMPGSYHFLSNKDGSAVSAPDVSKLYARGYIRLLENLTANVMTNYYTEPEPRPDNKGGYGNKSYSNNKPASASGGWDAGNDDLPL